MVKEAYDDTVNNDDGYADWLSRYGFSNLDSENNAFIEVYIDFPAYYFEVRNDNDVSYINSFDTRGITYEYTSYPNPALTNCKDAIAYMRYADSFVGEKLILTVNLHRELVYYRGCIIATSYPVMELWRALWESNQNDGSLDAFT